MYFSFPYISTHLRTSGNLVARESRIWAHWWSSAENTILLGNKLISFIANCSGRWSKGSKAPLHLRSIASVSPVSEMFNTIGVCSLKGLKQRGHLESASLGIALAPDSLVYDLFFKFTAIATNLLIVTISFPCP